MSESAKVVLGRVLIKAQIAAARPRYQQSQAENDTPATGVDIFFTVVVQKMRSDVATPNSKKMV